MWLKSLIFNLIIFSISSVYSNANDGKPILQEILLPRNLAVNKTIRLNCNLIDGGQNVKFQWFLNDLQLKSNNRRRIILHDESSELVIKSLSIDDLGDYKCLAINSFGKDEQKVSLNFNGGSYFLNR